MSEPRTQHGFQRTTCGCPICQVPCRHMPGTLDVADLERLCPAGQDLFLWAEQHLRALTDKSYPALVPARQANGHCHWLFEGRCVVHENSPYGCAFFDSHMPADEALRRSEAAADARRADAAQNGLYFRVWQHLCKKGLTQRSGDRPAIVADGRQVLRRAERNRRRALE